MVAAAQEARRPHRRGRELRRTYTKLFLAAVVAGALGWGAARACADALGTGTGTWATTLALAAGTGAMALGYLVLARLLKVSELRSLLGPK